MHALRRFFAALLLLAAAATLVPPAQAKESFTLEGFFAGRTVAEGSFTAINGVRRSFTVDLTGRWNGRTLVLVEDFRFDDGTKDRKTWRFVKTGPGRYTGTREDVVGETTVRISGDVARFSYDVYLDGEARKNLVRFSDLMELRPDGTVLNQALVTKFAIPVAWTRVRFSRP